MPASLDRLLHYFREISAIPRSSGNTAPIAAYCAAFATAHGLRHLRDNADNVIIFKDGSVGRTDEAPIILQGHLDMVCVKTPDSPMDFAKESIPLYLDGDTLTADGTSLGADNGIAVAILLTILESNTLSHPPLEVVLTSDEEIGMIGAAKLDVSPLKGKRMINLDAEEEDTITVSCAGGSDCQLHFPVTRHRQNGHVITVTVSGLRGGHSGMEIHRSRSNAAILMGNALASLSTPALLHIDSGTKGNAIPDSAVCRLCVSPEDVDITYQHLHTHFQSLAQQLADSEPDFAYHIDMAPAEDCEVFDGKALIDCLCHTPNGVITMSDTVADLPDTSLNLGILRTDNDTVLLHYTLRSNRRDGLTELEQALTRFAQSYPCRADRFGFYPPWEYDPHSKLRAVYARCFEQQYHQPPHIAAIHAGLECGVFCEKINTLDCLSVGPDITAVHTVDEAVSLSSVDRFFELLTSVLENA